MLARTDRINPITPIISPAAYKLKQKYFMFQGIRMNLDEIMQNSGEFWRFELFFAYALKKKIK